MIKPENKKPYKQFVNYLKNTSATSLNHPQTFKEKLILSDKQFHQNEIHSGPVEGDFSKIGSAYILEDDKLIKESFIYKNQKTIKIINQNQEQNSEPQNIQLIKEITKLQYLEKKGYLKPQEQKRLQKLRGLNLMHYNNTSNNIPQITIKQPKNEMAYPNSYQVDYQNINPNIYRQQQVNPKGSYSEEILFNSQNHQIESNNHEQKLKYFKPKLSALKTNPNQVNRYYREYY